MTGTEKKAKKHLLRNYEIGVMELGVSIFAVHKLCFERELKN